MCIVPPKGFQYNIDYILLMSPVYCINSEWVSISEYFTRCSNLNRG